MRIRYTENCFICIGYQIWNVWFSNGQSDKWRNIQSGSSGRFFLKWVNPPINNLRDLRVEKLSLVILSLFYYRANLNHQITRLRTLKKLKARCKPATG